MSFDVPAKAYDLFMGRYSEPLALEFAGQADLRDGFRALDVGCGPGALTSRLVQRLGPASVSAVDPSPGFVEAVRERLPEVDVRCGAAEALPFPTGAYDVTLAQLVVHFMTDPAAGLAEMARVTRRGGLVTACVWDHAGGSGPLALFWRAVQDLDPGAPTEAGLAGAREGHLAELCERAGMEGIESTALSVTVPYEGFEQWWEPLTLGVGPAGHHVARLECAERAALRDRCASLLPGGPFEVTATAWCVRARPGTSVGG